MGFLLIGLDQSFNSICENLEGYKTMSIPTTSEECIQRAIAAEDRAIYFEEQNMLISANENWSMASMWRCKAASYPSDNK